jgi:hypothetical protein
MKGSALEYVKRSDRTVTFQNDAQYYLKMERKDRKFQLAADRV